MNVGFSYGFFGDKLETQANKQGFTLGDKADFAEQLRDALNILRIESILTDSQCDKAYPRLQKFVVKNLKRLPDKEVSDEQQK